MELNCAGCCNKQDSNLSSFITHVYFARIPTLPVDGHLLPGHSGIQLLPPSPGPGHLAHLFGEGRRGSPGRDLPAYFANLEMVLNTGSSEGSHGGGLGWSLRICTCNKLLGDAAAGLGAHFEYREASLLPTPHWPQLVPTVRCKGGREMKFSCLRRSWRNLDQLTREAGAGKRNLALPPQQYCCSGGTKRKS